jgi:hypothetical protein
MLLVLLALLALLPLLLLLLALVLAQLVLLVLAALLLPFLLQALVLLALLLWQIIWQSQCNTRQSQCRLPLLLKQEQEQCLPSRWQLWQQALPGGNYPKGGICSQVSSNC